MGGGAAASSANAGGSAPPATVKVWDPFVRIFHWSLAALVLIAFLTGDEAVLIHVAVGYAIVGLVAARIVWGFIGPPHARFSDFVKSPTETLRYGAQALFCPITSLYRPQPARRGDDRGVAGDARHHLRRRLPAVDRRLLGRRDAERPARGDGLSDARHGGPASWWRRVGRFRRIARTSSRR